MRDGLTETGTMIIALIVLIFVPMGLSYVKAEIVTENKATDMICTVVDEANSDGLLTLAEAEHVVRVAALQKRPMRLRYYSLEGIESGSFGGFIYTVDQDQLADILEQQGQIAISEGGLISVHR